MVLESASLGEPLMTHFTLVWSLSVIGCHMRLQITGMAESLMAHVAFVWSLTRVG